jgi:hypothetical protein
MKIIKHFKKIIKHKKYVYHASKEFKIPITGIFHDLSKFLPIEFFESVKFYQGIRSPIDKAKEVQGYSLAWANHKGKNKHHWEHWTDWKNGQVYAMKIPFKRVVEMVCDYIGAGKAYEEDEWHIEKPLKRWNNYKKLYVIHEDTEILLDLIFTLYSKGFRFNRKELRDIKKIYTKGENNYKDWNLSHDNIRFGT